MEEETFVMSGLKMSLIGRPAIEALNLVSRVNSVDDLKQMYATWYLNLHFAVELTDMPSVEPFLTLMAYQSTPLQNGYSHAEVLIGRRI